MLLRLDSCNLRLASVLPVQQRVIDCTRRAIQTCSVYLQLYPFFHLNFSSRKTQSATATYQAQTSGDHPILSWLLHQLHPTESEGWEEQLGRFGVCNPTRSLGARLVWLDPDMQVLFFVFHGAHVFLGGQSVAVNAFFPLLLPWA